MFKVTEILNNVFIADLLPSMMLNLEKRLVFGDVTDKVYSGTFLTQVTYSAVYYTHCVGFACLRCIVCTK